MDMLCMYKGTFRLRDGIGTCPNMQVEIHVTDKSTFKIRPYQVKEDDKAILEKEI